MTLVKHQIFWTPLWVLVIFLLGETCFSWEKKTSLRKWDWPTKLAQASRNLWWMFFAPPPLFSFNNGKRTMLKVVISSHIYIDTYIYIQSYIHIYICTYITWPSIYHLTINFTHINTYMMIGPFLLAASGPEFRHDVRQMELLRTPAEQVTVEGLYLGSSD